MIKEMGLLVSDCGRVFRGDGYEYRLSTCRGGYKRVWVTINGERKSIGVHRLVAMAHLPNSNHGQLWVHHKDNCKSNNRIENLEWVTPSQNRIKAWEDGRFSRKRRPSLKKKMVLDLTRIGYGPVEIAEAFDVEISGIIAMIARDSGYDLSA